MAHSRRGAAGAAGAAPATEGAGGRLVTLAECVETVGEREHEVARQGVILGVVDIVGGDVAGHRLFLLEYIVDLELHCGGLVAEELVGD